MFRDTDFIFQGEDPTEDLMRYFGMLNDGTEQQKRLLITSTVLCGASVLNPEYYPDEYREMASDVIEAITRLTKSNDPKERQLGEQMREMFVKGPLGLTNPFEE